MISLKDIRHVLDNRDPDFIEELARQARDKTVQHFGRAISLYAPLYLSNYCSNRCLYCGYNTDLAIERKKLSPEEMHREMAIVANKGIRSILLLTGESREMTPVAYLMDAVGAAKKYFSSIALEIYPLEVDEYRRLYRAGVDGVTIYQETYHKERYRTLHRAGKKRDYDYRREAPQRIAKAGIRVINMGVLLGLSAIAEDVFELFSHLAEMEKNYPGVEYALSFPRLVPLENSQVQYYPVPDPDLVKLICLARILFPRVGINLSTRERPRFRDHVLPLGVTRISAESCTCVGGYGEGSSADNQFEVMDTRSVDEIKAMLEKKGFDPVFTDWRRIANE